MNKDTGKWFDFHKIPWHNNNKCHQKQSFLVEIKEKDFNPDLESDKEINGRTHIIEANPNVIVVTTKIQPEEHQDPEYRERLFHSHMWVKGTHCISLLIAEDRKTSSQ
jgi:hypothetical protein